MKILLVHGVSHCEQDPNYYAPWKKTIAAGLATAGLTEVPEFVEFDYDDLFEKYYSGPGLYATALVELAATTVEHAVLDPLKNYIDGLLHPSRALVWGGDTVRWSAGMVAQLVVESGLRGELRGRLAGVLAAEQPDVVAAHSLGSLLTFDFLHNDARGQQLGQFTYLTFGSQINNPFVRSRLWPGTMEMPPVRQWFHLYNPKDPVFTADITLRGEPQFTRVLTPSGAGHSPVTTADGPGYLDHPAAAQFVWPVLAAPAPVARALVRTAAKPRPAPAKPHRRALLIGINDYPDPANRLEGCVNDTFLMSALLQERGFAAEDIRVVLNERATAAAIRERLAWLLEEVGDGMERVLFYSGHGAQLPGYNAAETVDHVDECLVPYDFAWTKETAIIDDDFYRLYSDLPFSAHFIAAFDCCHAGGMTREGGRKIRGLTPPDDIRHRLLKWNMEEQMWQERELPPLNKSYGGSAGERHALTGRNGATYRLGRGTKLSRFTSKAQARQLVKAKRGLYLPVLLEACKEEQLSYEYRHGTISYGAFTYSLVKNLRKTPRSTFEQLMSRTTKSLQTLGYDQTPQLVGPSAVLNAPIPGN